MTASAHENEYNEDFITALQWMWGDGYLSPGGPREVAKMLGGVQVNGRKVLDVGCGLGAIDVLLSQTYGAASVVGIDIEQPLVDHARCRIESAGLAESVRIEYVEPGPLPFDNGSFDMVFSKDSIIHIPDKAAFYAEVLRVLTPGGVFVGSDWLRGGAGAYSEQMQVWLELVHLSFEMKNLDQTRAALEEAGFTGVQLRDRNEWYREEVRNELETIAGDRFDELARRIGREKADHRLSSSSAKQVVIERGELRPTHFIGYKPG
jgi:phosphoethanolamine N-methyltransferase